MPEDAGDVEIRPPDEDEPAYARTRVRRRGSGAPIAGATLVLLAAGGAAFYLAQRARAPRKAETPAAVPSAEARTPAPTAAPAATRGPLPALDDSDAYVRGIAAGLSSHPEVARWLARNALVRTLTAVVSDIAHGESPRRELDFLTPAQRFRAAGDERGRTVADPACYAAYDLFGDAVASIDAGAAASAYRATEPLFDAAYKDLGFPNGFRPALDTAIHDLRAVPVTAADAELQPHASGFRWADAELEALTSAQKQLLRTGPRNVRLVQGKLKELEAALARAR